MKNIDNKPLPVEIDKKQPQMYTQKELDNFAIEGRKRRNAQAIEQQNAIKKRNNALKIQERAIKNLKYKLVEETKRADEAEVDLNSICKRLELGHQDDFANFDCIEAEISGREDLFQQANEQLEKLKKLSQNLINELAHHSVNHLDDFINLDLYLKEIE